MLKTLQWVLQLDLSGNRLFSVPTCPLDELYYEPSGLAGMGHVLAYRVAMIGEESSPSQQNAAGTV